MSEPNILGRWYAEPLEAVSAQRLFDLATKRLEKRLRHGGGTLCCRLQLMRAKFWQGAEVHNDYEALQHLAARTSHGRALLELAYGQLLLSRQLTGALEHLDKGFDLARNLFSASDYFTVMNRHRHFRHLPLAKHPSAPSSLEQLLVMAQVIERLEKPEKKRGKYDFDKHDTYG